MEPAMKRRTESTTKEIVFSRKEGDLSSTPFGRALYIAVVEQRGLNDAPEAVLALEIVVRYGMPSLYKHLHRVHDHIVYERMAMDSLANDVWCIDDEGVQRSPELVSDDQDDMDIGHFPLY